MNSNKMNKIILRVGLSLVLAAVLLFCVFGFMATFEPLERSVQIKWRIVYGVIAAGCVGGVIFVWRKK